MNEIDNAFGFNDRPSGEVKEEKYKNVEKGLGDNDAEKVISIVANVTLFLGIFGSFMVFCVENKWFFALSVLFGTIVTWAFLMVIANISNNIRQIKYEVRKLNATTDNFQTLAPKKEKEQPTSPVANPNEMYVGGIKMETEE